MGLRDRVRRAVGAGSGAREPHLSFGSWDSFPDDSPRVVQVCHPDWRGVKAATYAFRAPVIEVDDLNRWGDELISSLQRSGVDGVIIQGWPPGSGRFVERLSQAGIRVLCVLHSSPAQQGAELGEAAVVDEVLALGRIGHLSKVGMVKEGVAAAFNRLGYPVVHVPNRAPVLPERISLGLGSGFHVGVFAEPFWRKNVTTQLLAVGLIDESVAHVMVRPPNGYLKGLDLVEHGELPWRDFISAQGSMDLNLYVTLSECHPATPQESYLSGVPCLISRVSEVFRSDSRLWELTSVDEADNPSSIAKAAMTLVGNRAEALERASVWIGEADLRAANVWEQFVSS